MFYVYSVMRSMLNEREHAMALQKITKQVKAARHLWIHGSERGTKSELNLFFLLPDLLSFIDTYTNTMLI